MAADEIDRRNDERDAERRRAQSADFDRRDDELDAERRRAAESDAFNEAISKHDHDTLRRLLGIPDPDTEPDDAEPDDAERDNQPPTAEEQFRRHLHSLRFALETSEMLPPAVTQDWRDRLQTVSFGGFPFLSLAIVNGVLARFNKASETYRPRNLFDVSKGMDFIREMDKIRMELVWLRNALNDCQTSLMRNRAQE